MPFDALFPNRPQHQDFANLAMLMTALDDRADAPEGEKIITEVIDGETLVYAAQQRAGRAQVFGVSGAALWMDAFVTGARWQEQKQRQTSMRLRELIKAKAEALAVFTEGGTREPSQQDYQAYDECRANFEADIAEAAEALFG